LTAGFLAAALIAVGALAVTFEDIFKNIEYVF
jgi:hypothetical protein